MAYRPNHPRDIFRGSKYCENIKTDVNKVSVFQGVSERNTNAGVCLFGKVAGLYGHSQSEHIKCTFLMKTVNCYDNAACDGRVSEHEALVSRY